MGHAEAAAHHDRVSLDLACFDLGNKTEIVCINVNVIPRRNRDRDLELTGEVLLPIERLFRGIGLG